VAVTAVLVNAHDVFHFEARPACSRLTAARPFATPKKLLATRCLLKLILRCHRNENRTSMFGAPRRALVSAPEVPIDLIDISISGLSSNCEDVSVSQTTRPRFDSAQNLR